MIIRDEIVMADSHTVEAVDRTLKDLMKINLPFGGTVVLFSGDFRQILPVVPCGSRGQVVNACFKSSPLFPLFKKIQLTENMRLMALMNDENADENALQFPTYLLKVGEDKFSDAVDSRIKLPTSVKIDSQRCKL